MGACMQRERIKQLERTLSNYQPPSESFDLASQFADKLVVQDNALDSNPIDTDRSARMKQVKSQLPLCLTNLTNFSSVSMRACTDAVWKTARKPMITLFIDKTHVTIPVFSMERAMADYERCEENMYRALKLAELKHPHISSASLLEALRYPNTEEMVFTESTDIFALLEDIDDFKELSFAKIPESYENYQISLADFLVIWRILHFWNIVQLYPQVVIFFRADADASGNCTFEEFNAEWRDAYKEDLHDNVFVQGQVVTLQGLVSAGERLNR